MIAGQQEAQYQGRWIAPNEGYAKINMDVDVSVHHNMGATTGVCYDWEGAYLWSSLLAIHGLINSVILEDLACRERLL